MLCNQSAATAPTGTASHHAEKPSYIIIGHSHANGTNRVNINRPNDSLCMAFSPISRPGPPGTSRCRAPSVEPSGRAAYGTAMNRRSQRVRVKKCVAADPSRRRVAPTPTSA